MVTILIYYLNGASNPNPTRTSESYVVDLLVNVKVAYTFCFILRGEIKSIRIEDFILRILLAD